MAVTLNSTGNSNGFIISSDNTGVMALQTVGSNSLVISNTQVATFSSEGNANVLTISGVGINVTGLLNSTGNITASQLISNVSTGTAPLVVTSTTVVANLNANALQGNTPSQTATANSIVQRNADGNITANFFVGNGTQLTGLSTIISNGNSNVSIPVANGNVNISAVGNANVLKITGTGANITGTANVTGNANVGNLGTSRLITTGNITVGAVTFANTDGTANQVLTTYGNGVTYWTTPTQSGNVSYNTSTATTGYLAFPSGTTAERPSSPANGWVRYNTTFEQLELYANSTWAALQTNRVIVNYAVAAGGGGGGRSIGGGGGGGGVIVGLNMLMPLNNPISVTIGAGGAGGAYVDGVNGGNGSNTVFGTITATGGGGGGGYNVVAVSGVAGGCGGGGAAADPGYGTPSGGAGNTSQGSNGGAGYISLGPWLAGGGGGANTVSGGTGADATSTQAGNGGYGYVPSIFYGPQFLGLGGCGGAHGDGGASGNGGTIVNAKGANTGGATGSSGINAGNGGAGAGSGGGGAGYGEGSAGSGGAGTVLLTVPNAYSIISTTGGISISYIDQGGVKKYIVTGGTGTITIG